MNWAEKLILGMMLSFCVAMFGLVFYSCWMDYKHPCIEYERRPCLDRQCTATMLNCNTVGSITNCVPMCIQFQDVPSTCVVCAQRE